MMIGDLIQNLILEIKKGYLDETDYYYKYENSIENNTFLEDEVGMHFQNIDGLPPYHPSYYIKILGDYFFYRSVYKILILGKGEEAKLDIIRAKCYGYLSVQSGSQSCNCSQIISRRYSLDMDDISPYLSLSVIANDWNMTEILTNHLINSLNGKSCVIGRGKPNAHIAWFIIILMSKYLNKPIDDKKPRYPTDKSFSFYTEILDKWMTKDLVYFDKMIYFLADLHIGNLRKGSKAYLKILPYEALMLLRLRENKGIDNPIEYSHPLMNTAISSYFINQKDILLTTRELPFAKRLLEEAKNECSNIDIPAWLF